MLRTNNRTVCGSFQHQAFAVRRSEADRSRIFARAPLRAGNRCSIRNLFRNLVAKFGSFREDSERQPIARESSAHRLWRTGEDSERFQRKTAKENIRELLLYPVELRAKVKRPYSREKRWHVSRLGSLSKHNRLVLQ